MSCLFDFPDILYIYQGLEVMGVEKCLEIRG